mgnify:CR=1 FL=1
MKAIGIIPARYASTRFPGKPLADIRGKSMIRRVYEQSKACKELQKVVVATDDQRILDHVKDFGGEAMMTRSDHASGTERCGEVIPKLKGDYEYVVNIQGDEPFLDPGQISLLLRCFDNPATGIATLVKETENQDEIRNPDIVKVIPSADLTALCFSRLPIPYVRDPEKEKGVVFYKHIGLYGFRRKVLEKLLNLPPAPPEQAESLEQLRWLYHGYKIQLALSDQESHSVDTPGDLSKILNTP